MKKIITILIFLIILAGCSITSSYGGNKSFDFNGKDKNLKLGASRDKILNEVEENDIVTYNYVSDKEIPTAVYNNGKKLLIEDITKRTSISQSFKDGNNEIVRYWSSSAFYKDTAQNKFFRIDYSTTTKEVFDAQVAPDILSKAIWFFVKSANADTYTISTGNNGIRDYNNNYATARSGGGTLGLNAGNNPALEAAQSTFISPTYYIDRLFVQFDISTIGAGKTINSSSLQVVGTTLVNGVSSLSLASSTPASTDTIASSDFNKLNYVKLSNDISYNGSFATSTFTFTSTGINYIDTVKTSYAKFAIIDIKDMENTTPSAYIYAYIKMGGATDVNGRPILTVTYSSGGTAAPTPNNNLVIFE